MDQRDHLYEWFMPQDVAAALPPIGRISSSMCPPVYDQGQLGSCTSNAIAGAIEFNQIKAGNTAPFIPSRLFVYYNERKIEHTVKSDGGPDQGRYQDH